MAEIYWRDSQRTTRFFIFDAKAVFAVALWIFHARMWTFLLAILIMIIFWMLERKGLNFTTALRTFRSFIIGQDRPRAAKLEKTTMKDYG
jgi:intracellular multiplication protein IcmT